jgi:hypothetical protein
MKRLAIRQFGRVTLVELRGNGRDRGTITKSLAAAIGWGRGGGDRGHRPIAARSHPANDPTNPRPGSGKRKRSARVSKSVFPGRKPVFCGAKAASVIGLAAGPADRSIGPVCLNLQSGISIDPDP